MKAKQSPGVLRDHCWICDGWEWEEENEVSRLSIVYLDAIKY